MHILMAESAWIRSQGPQKDIEQGAGEGKAVEITGTSILSSLAGLPASSFLNGVWNGRHTIPCPSAQHLAWVASHSVPRACVSGQCGQLQWSELGLGKIMEVGAPWLSAYVGAYLKSQGPDSITWQGPSAPARLSWCLKLWQGKIKTLVSPSLKACKLFSSSLGGKCHGLPIG